MTQLFYGVWSCDFCHKYVYEILGTQHSHFHTCVGAAILHTIIPVSLLSIEKKPQPLEVFGSNPTTEQLFPEPGFLVCGYCKRVFPRRYIAYHAFYCRSTLTFDFPDEDPKKKSKSDASTEYVQACALRIEFVFFRFYSLTFL